VIFLFTGGNISIGFLDKSSHLLKLIHASRDINLWELQNLVSDDKIVFRNQGSKIVDNAFVNHWVSINNEGRIEISKTLNLFIDNELDLQREMLWLYIKLSKPPWIRKLIHGINDARLGIYDADTKQVFTELGLFDEYNKIEVKKWWNKVSKFCRDLKNDRLAEIGMNGELMTLQFEKNRTGVEPIHSSMESDEYGYDIKSQISSIDNSDLFIEVKATERPLNNARFYLTKNEVKHCLDLAPNYLIYLWQIIGKKSKLKIISSTDLKKYIPTNNCGGAWESMSLKYDLFDWTDSIEGGFEIAN
jgi:hypothetical protein